MDVSATEQRLHSPLVARFQIAYGLVGSGNKPPFLGIPETSLHFVVCHFPNTAITLSSIAIGVGNERISIVVRVGFGLPAPAKCSA